MKIATCGTCGARVVWALTTGDKAVMVDADPVEDGDRWLVKGKLAAPVSVKADPEVEQAARYKVHFATCPDAEAHRKS